MSNDSYRCLDLLFPVVEIHMRYRILWRVDIRIAFVFPVLDLQGSRYSLRTEGNLISSGATSN